jgi:hypothetical protein
MAVRPYEYEQTIAVSVTVPANTPAGTLIQLDIVANPLTGAVQKEVVIPASQSWYITDIYIKSADDVGVDAQAILQKNNVKVLLVTDPLSSLLISNPSRPRYPVLYYGPNDRLSGYIRTLAATGASPVTITFYMKVRVVDTTFFSA